jgi:peroxiredoxin
MRQALIKSIVIAAWIIITLAGFWHFEAQYFRPAARPVGAAIADPMRNPIPPLRALATSAGRATFGDGERVTVLNFWNAYCPCSRFEEPDVKSLVSRYAPGGVRFITVVEGEPAADAMRRWHSRGFGTMAVVGDPGGEIARKFGIWAAPGAVVLGHRGLITYVGGYNSARYCDSSDTAWAEQAIVATVQGKQPHMATSPFYGCQVLGAH